MARKKWMPPEHWVRVDNGDIQEGGQANVIRVRRIAEGSTEADWPEGVSVTLPPVCAECARLSVRMCPALRTGYVAVRAESWICGVTGARFQASPNGLQAVPDQNEDDFVYYKDPAVRWVLATQRVRMLYKCTFVDLDQLAT